MRNLLLSTLAIVLAGCAAGADRASAVSAADIRNATAAWGAAYDSRDPARIVAMYDSDAVLWGTTSVTLRKGTAEITDYFKEAAKRPQARVIFGVQEARIVGDLGINSGAYTFTDNRDGKATSNAARFTMVFRQRDGRWVLVDHHSSRLPAP